MIRSNGWTYIVIHKISQTTQFCISRLHSLITDPINPIIKSFVIAGQPNSKLFEISRALLRLALSEDTSMSDLALLFSYNIETKFNCANLGARF